MTKHPMCDPVHPVLCDAIWDDPNLPGWFAEHAHTCVHPAKRPEGVTGILEHT